MLLAEIVETYFSFLSSLALSFSCFDFSGAQKWIVHDTFSSLVYEETSLLLLIYIAYLCILITCSRLLNSPPNQKMRSTVFCIHL